MGGSSSGLIEGCCGFIDFTCGCCGLIWQSTYTEVYKILDGEHVSCDKCKNNVRPNTNENRRIKYALFRHSFIWCFWVVCGLVWLLVVGAIFEWVSYMAGFVVLSISIFLVWCTKVSYEGGKVFDITLDVF